MRSAADPDPAPYNFPGSGSEVGMDPDPTKTVKIFSDPGSGSVSYGSTTLLL